MHQYIREQADALAQKRLGEYQQMRDWVRYEPPRQILTHQGPLHRGGRLISRECHLTRNLLNEEPEIREVQLTPG